MTFQRKSKLKKRIGPNLGLAYQGSRVSRKDAFQEEEEEDYGDYYDTPSLASEGYMSDKDETASSMASLERSAQLENGMTNGHKNLDRSYDSDISMSDVGENAASSDGTASLQGHDSSQSSVGDYADDYSEGDRSTASDDDDNKEENDDDVTSRAAVRQILQDEQKVVATNMSRAIRADIQKGIAVKKQKATFDGLLNVRIKMQQALAAANTLPLVDNIQLSNGQSTKEMILEARPKSTNKNNGEDNKVLVESELDAAEEAAMNLWKSLTTLRDSISQAHDEPQKRKRESSPSHRYHDFNTTVPSETLWQVMQDQEISNTRTRHTILNKWSTRLRGSNLSSSSNNNNNINHTRRINPSSSIHLKQHQQQSLPDLLATDLIPNSTSHNRLIARAHTVRSCAPTHSSRGLTSSQEIYDDADFYGSLLQVFLEQRSQHGDIRGGGEIIMGNGANTNGVSVTAAAGIAADKPLFFAPRWQAAKAAKVKKVVDTRASKGRKLKYTVHEKLQNFMAPEDRGNWDERQTDELFGSLFGRRIGLDENESQDESDRERGDGKAGGAEEEASYLLYGR